MKYLEFTRKLCPLIVKLLVDAGTKINQINRHGLNGLQLLFWKFNIKAVNKIAFMETADILIAAGISVNA